MKKKNLIQSKAKSVKRLLERGASLWMVFVWSAFSYIYCLSPCIQNGFVNLDDNVYGPEENYLLKSLSWTNIRAIFHTPVQVIIIR